MKPIHQIIVNRIEASRFTHQETTAVHTVAAAEMTLARMAATAPEGGAYDKTEVTLLFTDGTFCQLRVDLNRKHMAGYDLTAHHARFVAARG